MEKLLNNLYIYEIVLLFLGIFLFMVLCASLIYSIAKKHDIKKLLYFFAIPIIMIAYPSIQEIKVENNKLAIIKYQERVKENPNNEAAKEQLAEVTEKLEKRASSPADMAVISESYLLLENPEKAISFADKAITTDTKTMMATGSPIEKTVPGETVESNELLVNESLVNRVKTLEGIKAMADIQKEIKTDSTVLKDSLLLKARIQDIKTISPKTQEYFNRKYIQRNFSTTNKN